MSDGPGTRSERGDGKTRQYATFFVSDLFFGVEVLKVQEVLRYQQMTRVPRADDVIEVNPLLPRDTWDYFCLDNVKYHSRLMTIV